MSSIVAFVRGAGLGPWLVLLVRIREAKSLVLSMRYNSQWIRATGHSQIHCKQLVIKCHRSLNVLILNSPEIGGVKSRRIYFELQPAMWHLKNHATNLCTYRRPCADYQDDTG